ncbi:MAG: diacylglycerol kinase family protein [Jaaginema sp. PMC 1079.18]|nr:diacylglycerol kinase family protein [Jaaginema sp. PMC 1080.18]MEC4851340.1 diacylglycerol kinase family protein [Jaaginema sp. PMC 1079.18]MEC4865230.1 diacylglycerol kinase family protein [Jaaginema sp. PMC 1078.18]
MNFHQQLTTSSSSTGTPPYGAKSSSLLKSENPPPSESKRERSLPIPHRKLAWAVAPNLFLSFKYAWAGVRYAFITQRNFRIHSIIGTLAIGIGLALQVSTVEMAIVSLTCALVMVLELLNTALESVVDLTVQQTYHELAKIAKDCAAGAVLISAIAAVLVASLILLPPLGRAIAPFVS